MLKIWLVIFGVVIIFAATILGSALVFLIKSRYGEKFNLILMGITSGVMLSASIFGLLIPSINQAEAKDTGCSVMVAISVFVGVLLLMLLDKWLISKQKNARLNKKTIKLFLAITLHNIPEGLSVGLALGFAIFVNELSAYFSALSLAVGIALQNIPESLAVTLPIRAEKGKLKAFWFGVLSGAVEPVSALIGIALSTQLSLTMPYLLAMSAGAMLLVTVEDILPDTYSNNSRLGTICCFVGFVAMLLLEMFL